MNLRLLDDQTLAASFDETHLEADVLALVKALSAAGAGGSGSGSMVVNGQLPKEFQRSGPFLEQKIFNSISSETELMRYLHTLQKTPRWPFMAHSELFCSSMNAYVLIRTCTLQPPRLPS